MRRVTGIKIAGFLMAFAALLTLWWVGRERRLAGVFHGRWSDWQVGLGRGQVSVVHWPRGIPWPDDLSRFDFSGRGGYVVQYDGRDTVGFHALGFGFSHRARDSFDTDVFIMRRTIVGVPYWFLIALLALWFWRFVRRRRDRSPGFEVKVAASRKGWDGTDA